jgi:hypothetical protein
MRGLAFVIAFLAAPLAAQTIEPTPTVSIADPGNLSGVISLASPPQSLSDYGHSKVLWRADIHLPKGLSITRADMAGYAPIFLTSRSGRCFKLDFNGAGQTLTKVDLLPSACWPGVPAGASPPPPASSPPRAGLVYKGRAWDLIAWTDTRTGETMLIPEREDSAQPVLTTSMRVLAVGGLGSPDTPMTEVSLVGYVHGQLVATTVMLILP